jgi:hypothetical protein
MGSPRESVHHCKTDQTLKERAVGHQIYAGDDEVAFTDGAWLVVNWCERALPSPKPPVGSDWKDYVGTTDISAEAIKAADALVPSTYLDALNAGFLVGHYREPIDEQAFAQCRKFLKCAAAGGHYVRGSY